MSSITTAVLFNNLHTAEPQTAYALYLCFCTTSYSKHNIGSALLKYLNPAAILIANARYLKKLNKTKAKLSRLCVAPQRHYQSRVARLFALSERL